MPLHHFCRENVLPYTIWQRRTKCATYLCIQNEIDSNNNSNKKTTSLHCRLWLGMSMDNLMYLSGIATNVNTNYGGLCLKLLQWTCNQVIWRAHSWWGQLNKKVTHSHTHTHKFHFISVQFTCVQTKACHILWENWQIASRTRWREKCVTHKQRGLKQCSWVVRHN